MQTSLVSAAPGEVNAASDAQTQVADASTRPLAVTAPLQDGEPCEYPDRCSAGETPPVQDTTPADTELPAGTFTCNPAEASIAETAPFLRVTDSCDAEREALAAAGCTVVESVGINDDTIDNSDPTIPARLTAAGVENAALFQQWSCDGGGGASFTTNLDI